jgi:hypothetical protein
MPVRNPIHHETEIMKMTIANVLFGDPIPEEPTPSSKLKKRRKFANQLPTDILVWLSENEPNTFEELMDLRRALYAKKTQGQYQIRVGGLTAQGEQKILLVGPAGPLLVLSNKARHFLLRNLCRMRRRKGWPPIRY